MKKFLTLAILYMFLATITVSFTSKAEAQSRVQTGIVCIAASPADTSCPPEIFNAVAASGTNVTLPLLIEDSSTLTGVDISLKTDGRILDPVAVNFTGSVVPAPHQVVYDCINGTPVAGSGGSCIRGIDGNGVVTLGIVSIGGATIAPTTGLLFTVTYHLLSSVPEAIDVDVGRGATLNPICANLSVAGTNDCLLISAGIAVEPEIGMLGAVVGATSDPNAFATVNNVATGNTSTNIVCSPSTILPFATSTCTAAVTDDADASSIPTGTVSFVSLDISYGVVQDSCPLLSGNCSVIFTGSTDSVGAVLATVAGIYNGDAGHSASFDTFSPITIQKDATSTVVSCSPETVETYLSETCTASVVDTTNSSNTPTGTIQFDLSSQMAANFYPIFPSCTLSAGSCSVTSVALGLGSGNVTAIFFGDKTHDQSSGASGTIIAVKDNTSTTVNCSPTVIGVTGNSTCTAAVSDTVISTFSSNIPTGIVSFTSSQTSVGVVSASCVLSGVMNGLSICSAAFAGVSSGTATVAGVYGGDSTHSGGSGTSNTISVVPPVIVVKGQLSWTHSLSLSTTTCSCETWTMKISNPNNVTLFAQVHVVAIDGTGTTGFTITSDIITLAAGQSLTQTLQSPDLSADVGIEFHFTATIQSGTSSLLLTSPGGNTDSGSFAVVA